MAKQALKANPQTARVVGHSLGGAVALQLQKEDFFFVRHAQHHR
jgi:hypothetical protein